MFFAIHKTLIAEEEKRFMFAGRKQEIETLVNSFNKTKGTLNVIRGRRRIGKTRLIKELPNQRKGITLRYLTSSPPHPEVSDNEERALYAEQVKSEFALNYMPPHDTWRELFSFVADMCSQKRTILALDEINWLATKSPAIVKVLWEIWENQLTQKKEFMLILSGSLSSWIEKNIIMNKGFVGRVSVSLHLKELHLQDLPTFFGNGINKIPSFDLIKLLTAMGAVPRYLEEIDLSKTAEVNLNRLAFDNSGFLFDEFEKMFQDLFSKENQFYRTILEVIGNSNRLLEPKELADAMALTYSGRYSDALNVLEEVGFIRKQYTWDIKKQKLGTKGVLRLCDNYTAFYFRAILKNKSVGLLNTGAPKNLPSLFGLQFENLVHNNIHFVLNKLAINLKDVVFADYYTQTATTRRQGCQIDLLIQTKNRIYICECKLYSSEIGTNIINEIQNKLDKLPKLSGMTYHPVLIHANQVSEHLLEEDYFSQIIDISEALKA